MKQIIIGLVGQISSGKGITTDYLISKHGAVMIKYSDYLRLILDKLHVEINRKNLANLSLALRNIFGENVFSAAISEDIRSNESPIIIVDGIRRLEDIDDFKDNPQFHLVSIEADARIRYERLINRSENNDDKKKTYEEFLSDHELETEREIANIASKAEFHLENNAEAEMLFEQIDNLIKNLRK